MKRCTRCGVLIALVAIHFCHTTTRRELPAWVTQSPRSAEIIAATQALIDPHAEERWPGDGRVLPLTHPPTNATAMGPSRGWGEF